MSKRINELIENNELAALDAIDKIASKRTSTARIALSKIAHECLGHLVSMDINKAEKRSKT